jgi:hypothetical protein
MPPVQVPKDLLQACKLGATHAEAHLQAMLQQGANKRQLRPQILQMKDLEKMYGELNQKVMMAEMQAMQMQAMAQQNAGLAGMGGPGAGGPPGGMSGPMGLPLGNNAAGMAGPGAGGPSPGLAMAGAGGGQ